MEQITTVEEIPEQGSYLFTVLEPDGNKEEVILLRDGDDVADWLL